jgi:KDO2-lipid IV(A) lauroyltransferase
MVSVMRAMPNKKLTEYLLFKRAIFGQELCFKKFSFNILLKALRDGKSVGIMNDQHAGRIGVDTIFFGHPAKTVSSAGLLHLKTGCPILIGIALRRDDNFNYDLILDGPIKLEKSTGSIDEDAKVITQMITSAIEKYVRQYPVQWIWTHRRWTDIYKKKKKN